MSDRRAGSVNSGMKTSRFLRFHPALAFFEILIVFLPLISGLVICIETGSNHISLGNISSARAAGVSGAGWNSSCAYVIISRLVAEPGPISDCLYRKTG